MPSGSWETVAQEPNAAQVAAERQRMLLAERRAAKAAREPWQLDKQDLSYEFNKGEYWKQTLSEFTKEDKLWAGIYAAKSAKDNVLSKRAAFKRGYDQQRAQRYVHQSSIERALAAGKPVPPEVLADYPDLRVGNPSAVKRFLGGAFNRPGWILPFPEFVEKVRAEMVRRGHHGSGPLEPELVDTLRVMHDEALQAYQAGGPDAVDAALKGVRRNPLDLATIIGVGVLAGATQAIAQPWVTKHIFKVDAPPEPVMGVVGNPAGNARFYAAPLTGNKWEIRDCVTAERIGKRTYTRAAAVKAADKLNKDWAAGRIEVVAEGQSNPASAHKGYWHYRIVSHKAAPIRPFEEWTSDKARAHQLAVELADERGYPVEVYWSDLMDGTLSKSFTVKPPKEPSVPGAWGSRAPNPTRKEVTDRALRYRANATPPPGPRRCAFCGAGRVEVGHVNGHEEDNAPANLLWTCRPCNVRCGNTLRAAGVGRLTRQYNPDAKGAQSLGQWIMAVNCMKGIQGEMTVPAAVAIIRATPPEDRADFQAEAWRKRKRIYGKSGRQESIPF